MRAMKNIVILISGRGSNMEAIVRAAQAEQWPARIAAVISNVADAPGLQFAAQHGIATRVVDTIGAGDTFTGALAAALARGESLSDAASIANAAAALSVTGRGAIGAMPSLQAARYLHGS